MRKMPLSWLGLLILMLVLVSLACESATLVAAPTGTLAPPTLTTTATTRTTSTPQPTATPNLAATQQVEADQVALQKYVDSGYILLTQGTFYAFTDNTREMT